MFFRSPFTIILAGAVSILSAQAADNVADKAAGNAVKPRAVVELFTSQGCSSCPPADRLIGELAKDPSLIALSLPVDYWDYLGWKDSLALPNHSKRQRGYSKSRGDREVFTPQVVVNGSAYALGSDKQAIDTAIEKTRSRLSVPVAVTRQGDRLVVTLPDNGQTANAEVWLCPVTQQVMVAIDRGENHGRSIAYHNVVRRWIKLGDWSGKSAEFSAAMHDVTGGGAEIDSVVVLVQDGKGASSPGEMIGAATASLR